MSILRLILLFGVLSLSPFVAEAVPRNEARKKSDFSIVSVPLGRKNRCSPIFFCKTHVPKQSSGVRQKGRSTKPFTKAKQVTWCHQYAATILGKRNVRKQLLLVQIEPTVDLYRLKEIASVIAKQAKCRGPWPPNKRRVYESSSLMESTGLNMEGGGAAGFWASEEIMTLAEPGPTDERGVIVLPPGEEYTNPVIAAAIGPDYASPEGDFVASIDDIPTEDGCSCSAMEEE